MLGVAKRLMHELMGVQGRRERRKRLATLAGGCSVRWTRRL